MLTCIQRANGGSCLQPPSVVKLQQNDVIVLDLLRCAIKKLTQQKIQKKRYCHSNMTRIHIWCSIDPAESDQLHKDMMSN